MKKYDLKDRTNRTNAASVPYSSVFHITNYWSLILCIVLAADIFRGKNAVLQRREQASGLGRR